MSVAQPTGLQVDGDNSFTSVDTFAPAHQLDPGVAAEAINKRSEAGQAWPRHGIGAEAWGAVADGGMPRGYGRFNDPNGQDNLIYLSDARRNGGGEDGGRGRAWRITAGSVPVQIPLNGHDVWNECRLVACYNGVVMLRGRANERHYFSAAAVNFGTSRIQLNCAPAWANGEQVLFWADPDSYITGTTPPNPDTIYFVKNITGNKVELYSDPGLVTMLDLTSGAALGTFYLERRASAPGFYGNGAPSLILQPDGSGKTAFEVGFVAVTANVNVSGVDVTTHFVSAANHRLIPGDAVTYVHSGTGGAHYAKPLSADVLSLHPTLLDALAGTNIDTVAYSAGDYLYKTGGSGQPMPPGREGTYLPTGRLLIVNGKNAVAISDPLDPLHYAPFSATLNANLGESDAVVSLLPLGYDNAGQDITIVGKENSVASLVGLSGPSSGWRLKEVTREYGFAAALATTKCGSDLWGFGRKGVVSLMQTTQGDVMGVSLPKSRPMQKYLEMVDWRFMDQAAAVTWNNRYFLAVPLKGQTPATTLTIRNARPDLGSAAVILGTGPPPLDSSVTGWVITQNLDVAAGESVQVQPADWISQQLSIAHGLPANFAGTIVILDAVSYRFEPATTTVKNNGVLVYNFLTEGWEGLWQGEALEVYHWARHEVYGEERLTFVNYAGAVCWLTDGWTDTVAGAVQQISDMLLTRRYTGLLSYANDLRGPSRGGHKLWLKGRVIWETQNPLLTVTARAPGYNEDTVIIFQKTYDPTKYLAMGVPDYVPASSTPATFDLPNREDYSATAGELLAGTLDAHQNIVEQLRMRINDWGLQIMIENAQGSARILSVELEWVPQTRVASRAT